MVTHQRGVPAYNKFNVNPIDLDVPNRDRYKGRRKSCVSRFSGPSPSHGEERVRTAYLIRSHYFLSMITPKSANCFSLLIILPLWFVGVVHLSAQIGDNNETQSPPRPDIEVPSAPVLNAHEALHSFTLPLGFRIELVAAEPLVRDPVMMAFDVRGRLWVAELGAYNAEILTQLPVYLDKKQTPPTRPVGRVVVLEDTDGDGIMDKRTVYWDNMNVPRAIGFVANEVLIGDPPNLWLTRDVDGDGIMDEKILLDDKYGTPENVEASANGLLWGRDNWLYNASYKSRWRLVGREWRREAMPALGQWGMTQDDFGRLFYNANSDQLRGDLVPSHFAADRNARIPLYGVNFQVAEDQSTWPVRPTPGVNRGYRPEQLRDDGTLRTFTAASAPLVYRGVNFPDGFAGNVFVPEPAGNLVKRNLLLENSGRLTATNAYQGVDFLTSTDERFRPVYLANAPDGALYVVDFYRGMLEGYQFTTTYLRDQILKRRLNEPLWGCGRIYRIVYKDGPKSTVPDFIHADNATLVNLLTDDNGWTRDTAQRYIVDSAPSEIAAPLRTVLSGANKARDRVSALWCLEGIQALSRTDLEQALGDPSVELRIAAIQAAAPMFRDSANDALLIELQGRIASEQPIVLANLALSLAGSERPAARKILWAMFPRAAEHPSLLDAFLYAMTGSEREVLKRIEAQVVAEQGAFFGVQPLLEALAIHLVLEGGPAVDELAASICNKQLPQLCRLALMRGAIRGKSSALPEQLLVHLAIAAPDGWVRQKAAEAAETSRIQRAKLAARSEVAPMTPRQLASMELGKATFQICAGCHQPDGLGREGVAPSLKDGRWSAAESAEAAIRIVLKGKEGTLGYPAAMVPLGALSDDQIAAVLTFVRRSWGNNASAVDPAQVARVRQQISGRVNAWTDAELAKVTGESK